jgi:WD40 repeat protein
LWGQQDPTVFLFDGHLASIARDGALCIWDPEAQRGVVVLDAGPEQVSHLAAARGSPALASVDAKGLVKLWDGVSGRQVASLSPCASEPGCDHDGDGLALVLSDDGRLLVTSQYGGRRLFGAGSRGVVRFWDAPSGRELASVALPREGTALVAQKLALSSDGGRLAIHLGDHVEVWRLEGLAGSPAHGEGGGAAPAVELERVLLLPLDDESTFAERSLGFSRDGGFLVAGNGNLVGWETATWRQSWRLVPAAAGWPFGQELGQGFALVSDGRRILTANGVWAVP